MPVGDGGVDVQEGDGPTSILLVCTANQCRSPMAEVLVRRRLPAVDVGSAGVLGLAGRPAAGGAVRSMATFGLDLAHHRSRPLDDDEVAAADLVLAMARMHVREIVVRVPAALGTTFTLKELVRLAESAGPRPAGEPLSSWLAGLRPGRRAAALLGDDPADDVADPVGLRQSRFDACALELADLVERMALTLFPEAT
ncbi:MAG TPA: hypothetical protein VGH94_06500 [Acidimicrobiales bacterium]|jgi:protein-tyrosine phosphatase